MTNRERVSLERLIRTVHLQLSPTLLTALFASIEREFSMSSNAYTTDNTRAQWEHFKGQMTRVVGAYARRPDNPLGDLAKVQAELDEYKKQYEERGELLREALQEMERLEEEIVRLMHSVQGISARMVKKPHRIL